LEQFRWLSIVDGIAEYHRAELRLCEMQSCVPQSKNRR